jgi:hypothetical protein
MIYHPISLEGEKKKNEYKERYTRFHIVSLPEIATLAA